MTGFMLGAMLMAGSGLALHAPSAGAASHASAPLQLAQVTMRERVIIRVQTFTPRAAPAPRRPAAPPPKSLRWKEHKASRCVDIDTLASASVTRDDSVDLGLRNGSRLRARVDDNCPALDFYSGIYFKPNRDGKICADRDIIFSRAGSECEITAFKKLVPDP